MEFEILSYLLVSMPIINLGGTRDACQEIDGIHIGEDCIWTTSTEDGWEKNVETCQVNGGYLFDPFIMDQGLTILETFFNGSIINSRYRYGPKLTVTCNSMFGGQQGFHVDNDICLAYTSLSESDLLLCSEPLFAICMSKNPYVSRGQHSSYTNREVENMKREIKVKLTVNKRKLSSEKRRKTSVVDKRPSSQTIGYLGVAIIVILMSIVIGLDIPHFVEAYRNVRILLKT